MNGFYGALFCTIFADGAEVLGSSSESAAGERWPTKYKYYLRMLDPQSPFYSVKGVKPPEIFKMTIFQKFVHVCHC
jgi:hypothetical protein